MSRTAKDMKKIILAAAFVAISTTFAFGKVHSQRTPESSFIEKITYDDTKELLWVAIDGKSYCYENVPLYVWKGFSSANSKGSYYNSNVKNRYSRCYRSSL